MDHPIYLSYIILSYVILFVLIWIKLLINLFFYMALGFMIFITLAIVRVLLKVSPVLGPKQAQLSTKPFQCPP